MGHVTFILHIKEGSFSEECYHLTGTCHYITQNYHLQANGLVEHQNRTTEDCNRKCTDKSQKWLQLLDGILFSVCIAKHCSTKFSPFQIMYNKDPVIPFQLADNQRDGNPVHQASQRSQ